MRFVVLTTLIALSASLVTVSGSPAAYGTGRQLKRCGRGYGSSKNATASDNAQVATAQKLGNLTAVPIYLTSPANNGQRPARPSGGSPAVVIEKCTVPGTVAVTFDDGPTTTTPHLLDILAKYPDVRVTFFINGKNYQNTSLPEWQAVVKRAYDAGHQIGSHTYEHVELPTINEAKQREQMLKNDDVIYSAIGRVPRYMRPPAGKVNAQILSVLGDMGYQVINWSADTNDWKTDNAEQSASVYTKALQGGADPRTIFLNHDVMKSTAEQLMNKVLPEILSRKLRAVTVAECLGTNDPYL